MSLPIYTTTQVQDYLEGGTTRPFLAQVTDGRSLIGTFVVKAYTKKAMQQHFYIGAEACSNLLAKNFDLVVPEAAFIKVSKESLKALRSTNENMYNEITKKELGFCFGTRHMPNPILSPAYFKKLNGEVMEKIYGFDNLLLNNDRRNDKPNILITSDDLILIDHERTFNPIDMNYIQKGCLIPGCSNNHLFKQALKERIGGRDIKDLFASFSDCLTSLDTTPIESIKDQLTDNGLNTEGMSDWEDYLLYIKQNVRNFVTLLQNSIC